MGQLLSVSSELSRPQVAKLRAIGAIHGVGFYLVNQTDALRFADQGGSMHMNLIDALFLWQA